MSKHLELRVIWQEEPTPDAAERLAAAFDMLLRENLACSTNQNTSLDSIAAQAMMSNQPAREKSLNNSPPTNLSDPP